MPSNHLILFHPLLLLPSIFPNIRWPKYWSFSFNISPSNERSGLISFRMDWLDLLAVQGILKSLVQNHRSKTSILPRSHTITDYTSLDWRTGGLGENLGWILVPSRTARRSNQSILKEISPGISLEGMMLKLKLQYFGHLMRRVDSLEKTLMLGRIGGKRRMG